jgi:hypothetical protein
MACEDRNVGEDATPEIPDSPTFTLAMLVLGFALLGVILGNILLLQPIRIQQKLVVRKPRDFTVKSSQSDGSVALRKGTTQLALENILAIQALCVFEAEREYRRYGEFVPIGPQN